MRQYLIRGNKITLYHRSEARLPNNCLLISSARDLRDTALTTKQLIAIHSGLPGADARPKVPNRKAAVEGLWAALNALPEGKRIGSKRQSEPKRSTSKQARVVRMLRRPDGTSLEAIGKKMGWQPHTVRGLIAGALKKKLGLSVLSEKQPGSARRYRIAEAKR